MTLEMADSEGALYERYTYAARDMEYALTFAQHLLSKGWHFKFMHSKRRAKTFHHQLAYVTALVITYCRPFTKSRNWPALDVADLVYSDVQLALHERMRKQRDQFFAHTDGEHFEAEPIAASWGRGGAVLRMPELMIEQEDLKALVVMLMKARNAFSAGKRAMEEIIVASGRGRF